MDFGGDGLDDGEIFGWGNDLDFANDWKSVTGTFSLSGQPIFLYCLSNSGEKNPFLGFTYLNGTFVMPGDNITETTSYLPDSLGVAGLQDIAAGLRPGFANAVYSGQNPEVEYDRDVLKALVRDPANWQGTNDGRFEPPSAGVSRQGYLALLVVTLSVTLSTWIL